MIKNLSQLSPELIQDATFKGPEGKEFIDVNAHLLSLAEKGQIAQDLIREEATQAGISPVEQILAHSGIRMSGLHAHDLEVFDPENKEFKGASVLFPALAQEWLYQGLGIQAGDGFVTKPSSPGDSGYPTEMREVVDRRREGSRRLVQLEELVSIQFGINGDQYKTAVIEAVDDAEFEASRVVEGTEPPLYSLSTAERTVNFFKYGTRIKATYEVMRRQRIDRVQLLMQELNRAERRRLIRAALETAVNGDGNGNGALISPTLGTVSPQTLDEWTLDMAYENNDLNRFVSDLAGVKKVRSLRYPASNQQLTPDQLAMYGTSEYVMPDGTIIRLAPRRSVLEGAKLILGWNTGRALEQVIENGSTIKETVRWITNQTQEWVQTINTGFGKPFPDSFVGVAFP